MTTIEQRTKLNVDQLKRTVDPSTFPFETTADVEALTSIIGQKRGYEAMRFGLHMDKDGYNIYVSGIPGTGKKTFVESVVRDFASREATLYDWCYVNNFDDSYKPRVLQLPRGVGRTLEESMDGFIKNLKTDIPRAFEEESYKIEQQNIIDSFKRKTEEVIDRLQELANEAGFLIQPVPGGVMTLPLKDDTPMTEEEFHALDESEKQRIDEESVVLQEQMQPFLIELRDLERGVNEKVDALNKQVALGAAGHHIEALKEQFAFSEPILDYLESVQRDILKNIDDFLTSDESTEELLMSALSQPNVSDAIERKYKVNVLIDHAETEGAPIVFADNPTYYNVIGKVEYESRMGGMTTDFSKIKPGALHAANGGYLIVQVKDILTKNFAWEGLKRALLQEEVKIENIAEQAGAIATTSLQPEPIPLDVKVVFIGDMEMYQLLYQYDEDFRKLFKMKIDFDTEMDATMNNMEHLARFIHTHAVNHDLLHFDRGAVARIVEYSMRMADDQHKLSTRFNEQVEVMYEADTWAKLDGAFVVTERYVNKAIDKRKFRNNLYEEKVQDRIDDGSIFIDTDGAVVGQVNGLAVYNLGQYQFGKPSRITATTFAGPSGIINIERESKLSGSLHNKGVYILSGYLGQTFAQDVPLALTAHIAFEQSYGGVDGDSASSTELYALLSSLANVPIRQGFAVTGSVNQRGEVQPIGGVNEKIEGFFDVCASRGLTGEQGVLIPYANRHNLMLDARVIEAVARGEFHVYAIRTIEEGIELLTGVQATNRRDDGSFDPASIYGRVAERLKRFARIARANDDQTDQ